MLPCHILYNTFYSHIGDKSTIADSKGAFFCTERNFFESSLMIETILMQHNILKLNYIFLYLLLSLRYNAFTGTIVRTRSTYSIFVIVSSSQRHACKQKNKEPHDCACVRAPKSATYNKRRHMMALFSSSRFSSSYVIWWRRFSP
jgi:hypothetical protein